MRRALTSAKSIVKHKAKAQNSAPNRALGSIQNQALEIS